MNRKQLKHICLLLVFCLLISCAACGAESSAAPAANETAAETTAEAGEAAPAESTAAEETPSEDASQEEAAEASASVMRGDEFGNAAIGDNAAVSSFSEITSQVGIDILQAGGNAVDAAVATIFAVGVCEPHHSGIGGSGLMTIYLADEDRYLTIEYMEAVPLNYDGTYTKANDNETARGAGVPGMVAGLLYALEKYGTMTPAEVLAPSIKLAREGFELDSVTATAMADSYGKFMKEGNEYLAELFTDDGFPYSAGDYYTNEDLAETLELIAEGGADAFYTGEFAEKMVEGLQAGGSWITLEDFASYEPVERDAIVSDYYGYQVVACNYPTCGGVWELESLNIMESLDISQYEQGSNEYWRVFNEAIRIGALDSYTCFGDADKYNVPVDTLISQDFADERASLFDMSGAITTIPSCDLGDPESWGMKSEASLDPQTSTTHIAVVDAVGNVVSSTDTVGYSFGCLYAVEGTGFILNNHMLNHVNVENGGHVKSSMSPTIVAKDGKPVLAVGSPGSRVIPCAIMSVINNVLLYDMTVQEAINAPRCFILSYNGNKPLLELTAETMRMDSKLIRQLEVFGYSFDEVGSYNQEMGGIAAIYIDPETGTRYAGGDPRRGYQALAY